MNKSTMNTQAPIYRFASFPPDFMAKVRNILEPLKHIEEQINKRIEQEEMELGKIIPLNSIDTSDFDKDFERAIIQINGLLNSEVSEEKIKTLRRQYRKDKKELDKAKKKLERKSLKTLVQIEKPF